MIQTIRIGVPLLVATGCTMPLWLPVDSPAFGLACGIGTVAAFVLMGLMIIAHTRRR